MKDISLNVEFDYRTCVYYSKDYVSLYIKERDEIFEFSYKEGNKEFYNIAIKRPIDGTDYFDLETAYGYGGWFANTDDKGFINRAVLQYTKEVLSQNIVAEFIRFHPYNNFPILNQDIFDFFRYDRDVVIVNLTNTKENRWQSYSSTTRNKIKKGQKLLKLSINCNLQEFIDLYKQTMKKNKATDFYYFSDEYFKRLISMANTKVFCALLNDRMMAGAIFLESEFNVSYHLGAKDYNNNITSVNYFLFESIFDYYSKNGKMYALLGGGKTSDKDDSLFKFKQKFSKQTLPFYIAGKIFNKEIYERLSKQHKDSRLFLKWREK